LRCPTNSVEADDLLEDLGAIAELPLRVAEGLWSAGGSGAARGPITDDARDHHFPVSGRLDPSGIGDGSGMGDAAGIGDGGGNPERGGGIGDGEVVAAAAMVGLLAVVWCGLV
jgi:hypothetical protein